jgi:hypothetical protein
VKGDDVKIKLTDCTNNTWLDDIWIEFDHISVMKKTEHHLLDDEKNEFYYHNGSDLTLPYHGGVIKVKETPEEIIKLSKPLDQT